MSDLSYLRFPHLYGDLLTFAAEDDVWLAPLDGGRAWRLTADRVPVAHPRFSPDGELVAWASRRDGAPEVHLVGVEGGQARRLTYWGDWSTRVRGWTPEGEVLVITAVGSARHSWAHAVPVDGGPARRLPFGPVADVAFDAQRGVLLGSLTSMEPARWKRYRGGTAGKIWLDPDGSGEFSRILSDVDGHLVTPMWAAGRVVFLSDHEGVGNLYSCAADGSDLRRHTDHVEFYARHPSTDGARIVYQHAGELWLVEDLGDPDAVPRRLEIRLGGPRTGRQPHEVDAVDHLGALAPDRTGRASVVEVRGTVHWLTHRDGPARTLAAQPGVRARLPKVLGDTGRAVWVTDGEGEDALEVAPTDGSAAASRLAFGLLGRVLELAAAPDGSQVAVASHDGRVLLVDIESGEVREAARTDDGDCRGLAFSPDSAWVAWSQPGLAPLRHIRMARVADLSTVDVTDLRFVDTSPVFTLDGKYLALLSVRSFDPVYDAHSFDLSFPNGCRPYLVPLGATTPSPFAPELEGRAVESPDRDDKKDEAPVTVVDAEGLAQRMVPLPVPDARYFRLLAAKDSLLWLVQPLVGVLGDGRVDADGDAPRPRLQRYDLRKRRCDVLYEGLDAAGVSGDGCRLVVRDGHHLLVLPADRKSDSSDGDRVNVDLARLRVTVDPASEWRQMYDEAGRLMRDHFWVADMADVAWDNVLRRYRSLVDRVGSHDDLVDLLWDVNGELGTSHAYVMPDGRRYDHGRPQGLLGADLERDPDGIWRVTRVLPGESSDPRARSPLSAPGVAVRPGDGLLAIDGRPVDPVAGLGPLLAGAAGRAVELSVRRDGEDPRRVVVVPLADEGRLRYQDWVADRRRHVREATGGQVGYLHLPDMMAVGWSQLHRDLRVEAARNALIVDVRENRGGHVSQLVVEKLLPRVIGWAMARGSSPSTYPRNAPRGPVIVVANEFSGSDGDIIVAAVKALGIGPVVGTRTWGGVIGIDRRYALVDGTVVTQPRYAFWFDGGVGWSVENRGVEPDVEVIMTPQDWQAGRDPQLDEAVRLAMDALAQRPAATPPDPATRPSRVPPPLPPRRNSGSPR
ncbi:MAG: S41 family peptidase [Egibacteraceae bacterium]